MRKKQVSYVLGYRLHC